ncbi:MAG: DUF5309 family protein [Muribaculaceae bacterium]|nr:DUF5309 family protein [Muribaculaceae bacterium]
MNQLKQQLISLFGKAVEWLAQKYGIYTFIAMGAVILWWIIMGDGDSSITLASGMLIAGINGGKHVVDGPLTTSLSNEGSPDLLRNEIDERIVKIRPMSTPIDQLSRFGGSRSCGSMVVDYYSVDTKATETTLTQEHDEETEEGKSGEYYIATIHTENDEIFEPSETILVPNVSGYGPDGLSYDGTLVLYVLSRNDDGVKVIAVNGKSVMGYRNHVPTMEVGTKLIRMGRAASELDVQTAQFEALPTKMQNNCQIFKTQVEQSTFQKIANKEVGWSFSDQEEAAIIDMRLGMEKSFLFGSKARIYDSNKREDVLLTGGIWHQAGREFRYAKDDFNANSIIDLCRDAFTANAGSNRKILIGGTGLIEVINKLDYNKVISANETVTKWGIDFTELRSKFGTLYVLHSEVFDQCGHYYDGFVVDPEYITKYCHVPFRAEKLDLRKSGVRNTDAIVVTEASCLVLRYPQAHMRVIETSQA